MRTSRAFLAPYKAPRDGQQFAFQPRLSKGQTLRISVQHVAGARFTAEARHHRVVLDQPAEDGATDHGMSPAELLLGALGGCVGQYVVQYLSARGLSCDGLEVAVSAEPTSRSLHLGEFSVAVIAPSLNERQLRALETSFPAGLVQNAIRFENVLRITVASYAEVEACSGRPSLLPRS
jgi:putative redox protein